MVKIAIVFKKKIGTDIQGKINIDIKSDTDVKFILENENGEIYNGDSKNITIEKPILWNAEYPYLYTLYLITEDEVIKEKIGFREIKIAEADIEIHGAAAFYGGSNATTFGLLAQDTDWENAILDRVQRNVIRDKNRTSICLWSLGNEGGYGVNFENAGRWLKEYDSTRLTHYEGSRRQMEGHINDMSMLDVESTMYADYKWIDTYFENPGEKMWHRVSLGKGTELTGAAEWVNLSECNLSQKEKEQMSVIKPYMQCEFMHAMGNDPGGIKEYIDRLYKYDGFFGVFAWEWCDHAIDMGDGKYFYDGDFGEYPNDGNFCVDGLVYPNRKHQSKL